MKYTTHILIPAAFAAIALGALATEDSVRQASTSEKLRYSVRLNGLHLDSAANIKGHWNYWGDEVPDPFCEVKFNGIEYKTKVYKDVTEITFDSPMDRTYRLAFSGNRTDKFTVTCRDKDFFVNDWIFSISVSGDDLERRDEDGLVKIYVDSNGRRIEDPRKLGRGDFEHYHTLVLEAEEWIPGERDAQENKRVSNEEKSRNLLLKIGAATLVAGPVAGGTVYVCEKMNDSVGAAASEGARAENAKD